MHSRKQVLVKLPQCTRASACTIQTGRRKAGCCCWGKGINQQEMTAEVQPFINYRRARADSGSSSHTELWVVFFFCRHFLLSLEAPGVCRCCFKPQPRGAELCHTTQAIPLGRSCRPVLQKFLSRRIYEYLHRNPIINVAE